MSFEIVINGKPFTRWKSAKITRSIDNNCGVFEFTNSSSEPVTGYPIREGDAVKIMVNGVQRITGHVDNVSGSITDNFHDISVCGRDNIQDLIDSSVPDAAKVTEGPVTMASLCKRVINAIGVNIPVTSNVSGIKSFTDDDLQAAGTGDTCMNYLVSFARKRQVYLVSNGYGGLVIYRPDRSNKASSGIFHTVNGNNNILSCEFNRGMERRYNSYLCRSQDNFGFDPFADYANGDGCNRTGLATDNSVRATRYLEINAEQAMNDSDCKKRANEECNIRRTSGLSYGCVVPGLTQDDGTLWDYGQIVSLHDDYVGMSGEFLIKTVEYMVDILAGTLTRLELVLPDAYQVVANQSTADKRKAKVN